MNRRRFALGAALLASAALTSLVPGCATTEDLSRMFPVDFGTKITWNGTRITGKIHNNSGHTAHRP